MKNHKPMKYEDKIVCENTNNTEVNDKIMGILTMKMKDKAF